MSSQPQQDPWSSPACQHLKSLADHYRAGKKAAALLGSDPLAEPAFKIMEKGTASGLAHQLLANKEEFLTKATDRTFAEDLSSCVRSVPGVVENLRRESGGNEVLLAFRSLGVRLEGNEGIGY